MAGASARILARGCAPFALGSAWAALLAQAVAAPQPDLDYRAPAASPHAVLIVGMAEVEPTVSAPSQGGAMPSGERQGAEPERPGMPAMGLSAPQPQRSRCPMLAFPCLRP